MVLLHAAPSPFVQINLHFSSFCQYFIQNDNALEHLLVRHKTLINYKANVLKTILSEAWQPVDVSAQVSLYASPVPPGQTPGYRCPHCWSCHSPSRACVWRASGGQSPCHCPALRGLTLPAEYSYQHPRYPPLQPWGIEEYQNITSCARKAWLSDMSRNQCREKGRVYHHRCCEWDLFLDQNHGLFLFCSLTTHLTSRKSSSPTRRRIR